MPNARIWQSLGRETILECSITALPQAITYWQKDGRRITNTLRPAAAAAAARGGGGRHGDDDDDDDDEGGSMMTSRAYKYRIEAYDDGDHTITLNLRLQVYSTTTCYLL